MAFLLTCFLDCAKLRKPLRIEDCAYDKSEYQLAILYEVNESDI